MGTLRFSLLAAMVGMLIPTLVSAADSDESPPAEGVPEIVITGSSQSPWDHVGASTVIDREDMTGTLGDLAEALDEQPGLRVTRLGGLGSFSMVSIRGSTADQVLILVDGIPLNAAEGGPVDLSTLPLGPIQTLCVASWSEIAQPTDLEVLRLARRLLCANGPGRNGRQPGGRVSGWQLSGFGQPGGCFATRYPGGWCLHCLVGWTISGCGARAQFDE